MAKMRLISAMLLQIAEGDVSQKGGSHGTDVLIEADLRVMGVVVSPFVEVAGGQIHEDGRHLLGHH